MKKVFIAVLVLLCLGGIAGSVYFYMQYNTTKSEKEVLVQQNGELQSNIDAIGPITTAWTVAPDVATVGSVIDDTDLVELTIPQSSVTENTVLDKSTVVGKYFKITIKPGTTVTNDMVMEEEFADDTVYEQDMTFASIPLGLEVGNYVNIQITLPYGQTFIVLEHKRIEQLVKSSNTVKIYVNPAEQALLQSAGRDLMLYGTKGLSLYMAKYVEPGVQNATLACYPVRKEMESSVTIDPNIKDKSVCINAALRDQIELMLQGVTVEDSALLAAGVSAMDTGVNTAAGFYVKSNNTSATGTSTGTGTAIGNGDDTINLDDVNQSMDNLEQVGDSLSTPSTDADGNAATVTGAEVDNAKGDEVFSGEDIIE